MIIQKLRELGWKEFKRRWIQGIRRITPEQLLKTELRGITGSIIGTMLAGGFFVYWGLWPILLFLVFNIVIQTTQWISKYQQLKTIRELKTMTLDEFVGGEDE